MGTLIFHILLFSAFLLADINIKGNVKEEEIIIDFPDIPPEPEKPVEEKTEQMEDIPNEASQPNVESTKRTTNKASNQLATKDKFFDEDYQKEVEEAQKMVSNVNKQLSKKVVDINDIKMPVESTEGMNPDSIKNVIYTGESNITYYLENRYHVRLPIPVYLAQGGGKVIVNIVVDRQGRVIKAEAQKNPAIRDKNIYTYAEVAASKTIFNADPSAPAEQQGTIHYTFIAQ
jgi:outer membrane biosynthesis protein TonB